MISDKFVTFRAALRKSRVMCTDVVDGGILEERSIGEPMVEDGSFQSRDG